MRPSSLPVRSLMVLKPNAHLLRSQARLQSSLSTLPRRPFHPRLLLDRRSTFAPPRRYESSLVYQDDQTDQNEKNDEKDQPKPEPTYQLTFTCKPCLARSTHHITKHGYHKGTVLITCPTCKNRHVISDHLRIFMDTKSTLEDILRSKAGEDLPKLLKKGKLGIRPDSMIGNEGEENLEFWDDGTQTEHEPIQQKPEQ